eukprot:TRINITY_DN931_c0_g1_i1.p1 TRINITY_DN931_c0_g1~~TRINITY_DN931_c0_g1_i1.p1  ORF type:complete len:436 (+),score=197.10 TRINITY_DN931_c0_g1_i1:49-1308(+)
MSGVTRRKDKEGVPPKPADAAGAGEKKEQMLVDAPDRWKKWWTRTWWSIIMVGGFAGIIFFGGHLALCALVFVLQIFGFRELMAIRHNRIDVRLSPDSVPMYKFLDVMFFVAIQYYMYGTYFFARFRDFVISVPILELLYNYHNFISFSFFIIGVVLFVLSLKNGFYKLQFKQIIWTSMALIAMSPSTFHVPNIFNGIIWFLLPTSLIICNDITAFIWGFFFGRTPLIQLSPKKTWEGFIGAFFSTIAFSFLFAWYLGSYQYFTCPKISVFHHPVSCDANPLFTYTVYEVPSLVQSFLQIIGLGSIHTVTLLPIQIHAVIFGTFSSLIAPFGGFLASGFKRAFDIKDFGDVIPGHGGIVDRMDCQVVMALFTYIYYQSFIFPQTSTAWILETIQALPVESQTHIFAQLKQSLATAGVAV